MPFGPQAPDGSYRVTFSGDGPTVTSDDGYGAYAPDGSLRVTVTAVEGSYVLIKNNDTVTIDSTTYTFTVSNGAITAITTS